MELVVRGWDARGPRSPGGFGAFFVFALLFGLVTFVWRISLARRVAERSGLDPDEATERAILGEHGLAAGYLAGHLRDRSAGAPSTDVRMSDAGTPDAGTPDAGTPVAPPSSTPSNPSR